jgi:hypothetical protein
VKTDPSLAKEPMDTSMICAITCGAPAILCVRAVASRLDGERSIARRIGCSCCAHALARRSSSWRNFSSASDGRVAVLRQAHVASQFASLRGLFGAAVACVWKGPPGG